MEYVMVAGPDANLRIRATAATEGVYLEVYNRNSDRWTEVVGIVQTDPTAELAPAIVRRYNIGDVGEGHPGLPLGTLEVEVGDRGHILPRVD